MTKKFKLAKEELMHFDSLTYTMRYLEDSAQQFVSAIITERLGKNPKGKDITWKLDGNDLILEIEEIVEPTDFLVSEPSKQ